MGYYFMNPMADSFTGCLVLADRQLSLNFKVPANVNQYDNMVAWNQEPWNLTGNTNITFNYSFDYGKTWTALTINVTTSAASITTVKAFEVAAALNADPTFQTLFTASVTTDKSLTNWLKVNATRPRGKWKMYISNGNAESILRFNKKAGVAQLPTYFARHTISNSNSTVYPDSVGMLVQLSNPLVGSDVAIVTDAGLSTTILLDWQLMTGRSGMFNFQNITVDGSDRITQIIEYPAGAQAGDFARKINYLYTSTNTHPYQITEVPYTLAGGDLVTPP